MKSRTREGSIKSCYTYLKPGALAQIRNSKISAKSRFQDAKSLILELQENLSSGSEVRDSPAMDQIPCFDLRVKIRRPRCLLSKKLFAVAPLFSESSS